MAPLSDPERMKILGQCSLVSSWWFVRARHWMFYDVKVQIGSEERDFDRTRELRKLLQSSHSTIALHLRRVFISRGSRIDSPYDDLNELIIDVLPHLLDNISSLELENLIWSKLDESAQSCILRAQPDSLCLMHGSPSFGSPSDILALSSTINPYLKALKIQKNLRFHEEYPVESKLAPLPKRVATFDTSHYL
ncbi:hypothetical protein H0H92_002167 [Tricholoma furcatifolium]|nr:hypothetical protein H0H92_002167 [Tricholoma furcatifolium]